MFAAEQLINVSSSSVQTHTNAEPEERALGTAEAHESPDGRVKPWKSDCFIRAGGSEAPHMKRFAAKLGSGADKRVVVLVDSSGSPEPSSSAPILIAAVR